MIYPDIKYKSINIGNWDNGYVSIAVYASALYIIVKGITRNINNLIINFLRFLNGKKQIYITDGNKEIYFGYFISPKKYKEILALLGKVHQE